MYRKLHVVVALALTTACTVDTQSVAPGSSLELTQNDDTTVAGTFVYAGSIIEFSSTSPDQNQISVHLDVNGAQLDVVFDLANRTMERNGHLNAFFRNELDAILTLRDALTDTYAESLAATFQGRILVRELDRLAEAPAGHTFGKVSVDLNAKAVQQSVYQVSKGHCGDDGVTCLPGTHGSATAYFDRYDAGKCLAKDAHYGNSWCAGRCGAGCPTNNWWELVKDDDYTQDCYDHDWCVVYFDEGNGPDETHCGDEFEEAADDYAATVIDYCPE